MGDKESYGGWRDKFEDAELVEIGFFLLLASVSVCLFVISIIFIIAIIEGCS